jgi:hypothetical protein
VKNSKYKQGVSMFKVQYKARSPYESWNILGNYSSEANAIASAMQKKKRGALLIRIVDKRGAVVFVY